MNWPGPEKAYDLFISDPWKNKDVIDLFAAELLRQRPAYASSLIDKNSSQAVRGNKRFSWHLMIVGRLLRFYSPDYLASKVCREEFNIAIYRARDAEGKHILQPIFLHDVILPTYMKMVQYIDCREADPKLIRSACTQILAHL